MKIKPTILAPHHPKSWLELLPNEKTYFYQFNNTQHFINTVATMSQREDNNCDITYNDAVTELRLGKGTITEAEYQEVRNSVRAALLKRNLISETIYEGYEYTTQGELIDIARYLEGNPECVLQPKTTGKKWFYELYINASVPGHMSDTAVQNKLARILATIQLLEQDRIYIKLNAVMSGTNNARNKEENKPHMACIIPVFAHNEPKSLAKTSSIINTRLQRKFEYAILEHTYKDNLDSSYGQATRLPHTINLNSNIDECEIAEEILDKLVIKCKKKVLKC